MTLFLQSVLLDVTNRSSAGTDPGPGFGRNRIFTHPIPVPHKPVGSETEFWRTNAPSHFAEHPVEKSPGSRVLGRAVACFAILCMMATTLTLGWVWYKNQNHLLASQAREHERTSALLLRGNHLRRAAWSLTESSRAVSLRLAELARCESLEIQWATIERGSRKHEAIRPQLASRKVAESAPDRTVWLAAHSTKN